MKVTDKTSLESQLAESEEIFLKIERGEITANQIINEFTDSLKESGNYPPRKDSGLEEMLENHVNFWKGAEKYIKEGRA